MPLLIRAIPDIHLTVVGSNPSDHIRALAGEHVTIAGWVADLDPIYASTRVVVAPLRYGAGVKGKVGQALAMGVPMVTTSIGNDGMMLEPGRDIEIADDAHAFAERVIGLYENRSSWEAMSARGLERIDELFGRWATSRRIDALVDEFARRPASAQPGM
jgi:glycosyltransferase involved in cell wall biosynthesis